jgi:hypothetical protein
MLLIVAAVGAACAVPSGNVMKNSAEQNDIHGTDASLIKRFYQLLLFEFSVNFKWNLRAGRTKQFSNKENN